jgi:hypothetical protein
MLGTALGVSTPSISAWESGVVPPVERIRDYARAFATARTFLGPKPALIDGSHLTENEDQKWGALTDELISLRELALRPEDRIAVDSKPGSLGQFWHLPDGAPIRIITAPPWTADSRMKSPYASPWHPNYIAGLNDAHRDATTELYGHLRAANPLADVRFLTADAVSEEDLTGHVIILGQGPWLHHPLDTSNMLSYLAARLELPFGTQLRQEGDAQYDSAFVIASDSEGAPVYAGFRTPTSGERVYRPRFLRQTAQAGVAERQISEDGYPLLEHDVAVLYRAPNELNLATTVTICAGIFTRGTFGAVRALTDPALRGRNESFLLNHFDIDDFVAASFWLMFYVPVSRGPRGLGTVTPDLARPFHRLHDSR